MIALSLFLIPFLFWGNLRLVGGDDSQLYYFFPYQYLKNFAVNIISDNSLGGIGVYYPQAFLILCSLFLYFVKSIFFFVNIQFLMYGLNLALGFLFFYLLLSLFINKDDSTHLLIKVLSSLTYVLSIFSAYSVWSHHLLSLYLITLFPMGMFLFLKAVMQKKFYLVILNTLILSFFSAVVFTPPYLIALIISFSPSLLWIAFKNKKVFMKYSIFSLVFFTLLNLFWIIPFLHTLITPNISFGIGNKINAAESLASGRGVITAVSGQNQILYPLFNLFHKSIQINFNWDTYAIFTSWYLSFILVGLATSSAIILAGTVGLNKIGRYKPIYISAILGWLIILFFYTANIGGWGLNLFIWLNDHIPGFVMFKNMYDKFSLAMAFSYSYLLGISLAILTDTFKFDRYRKYMNHILVLFIFLVVINAKPFILDELYRAPLWTSKNTYTRINDFNDDFYDLVSYLKRSNDTSRYIWFPINRASYALVQDNRLPNHYYIGVSPIRFLANKSDITGSLSFPNFFAKNFTDAILDQDSETVGSYLQKMGIGYIILNRNISEDLQKSYIFTSLNEGDLFKAQSINFVSSLLGDKVADFGKRYTLYKINNKYKNEKIYLTSNTKKSTSSFNNITYQKIASYKYKIKIRGLKDNQQLVFLDPYHKGWDLYFPNNKTYLAGPQERIFNFANGWNIETKDLLTRNGSNIVKNKDGSIDVDLILYFSPQKYFFRAIIVSIGTLLVSLVYLFFYFIHKNAKKNV